VELPERLIHQHTYLGDLVLDPFMGAGATAVAAVRAGRHYAGYDTDASYVEAAKARVAGERPAPIADGSSALDATIALLTDAGFNEVRKVDREVAAVDRAGRPWRVLVGGPRTVTRPGLRRVEEAWRVVALASADPGLSLVVTPALPQASSPAAGVLREVTGAGRAIAALIELGSAEDAAVLRDIASAEVSGAAPRLPLARKRRA
jgi:site-specific DNA-methyltransferase (adenine-specific)